jgi:Transposase DDE domain
VIQGGMTHESLLNRDWEYIVRRLGGAASLERSARETGAFLQARVIKCAVDLLRLLLSYCLGDHGLRLTAAWATSVGLVDISAPALLYRLRKSSDWLSFLIDQLLQAATPKASRGRLIRIIDGTSVPKAGKKAKKESNLWRVHSAFDLPGERFSYFELTDEKEGETLDRIPVTKGEIRIGDRAYLQPDRIARILEAGGDVLVRGRWKGARWRDKKGQPIDFLALLRAAKNGRIDQPIFIERKGGPNLALRLVAIRKPEKAAAASRRKARRDAQREGYQVSKETLEAADWVILVTSLSPGNFSTEDVLDLYRLRWRIELGFKRLKSLIGLKEPPGLDERSARPYVLVHLLIILLLEPVVDGLEDSPPALAAA